MKAFARIGSSSLLLLAALLSAAAARAEDATATVRSASTNDEAKRIDETCRVEWFAMGPCRNRAWTGPLITFGLDFGVAAMTEAGPFGFGKGIGGATYAGPSWGFRASVELLPWLGLEGRYLGAYNGGQGSVTPSGSVGFLSTGGEAVLRVTAPLPFVRPYVLGGVGYYDITLAGGSAAQAASVLHSSAQPGIPMGVGVDIPLTWYLSLGVEAAYHFQLGESFASVTTNGIDGGDITTFGAVLRARPW
ncbi:MAG TPA: hypothetical protein VGL81_23520 [Polyangiaceae bacterium]|jgi:hypothetical protein